MGFELRISDSRYRHFLSLIFGCPSLGVEIYQPAKKMGVSTRYNCGNPILTRHSHRRKKEWKLLRRLPKRRERSYTTSQYRVSWEGFLGKRTRPGQSFMGKFSRKENETEDNFRGQSFLGRLSRKENETEDNSQGQSFLGSLSTRRMRPKETEDKFQGQSFLGRLSRKRMRLNEIEDNFQGQNFLGMLSRKRTRPKTTSKDRVSWEGCLAKERD